MTDDTYTLLKKLIDENDKANAMPPGIDHPGKIQLKHSVALLDKALEKGDRATLDWLHKFTLDADNKFAKAHELFPLVADKLATRYSPVPLETAVLGTPQENAKNIIGQVISYLRTETMLHRGVHGAISHALNTLPREGRVRE